MLIYTYYRISCAVAAETGKPIERYVLFFKNTYTHRYIYVNVCIDEYMYMHIYIYSASPVQWNVLFIFYFSRFDAISPPRKRANN